MDHKDFYKFRCGLLLLYNYGLLISSANSLFIQLWKKRIQSVHYYLVNIVNLKNMRLNFFTKAT